jgi:hypothetical protein
MPDNATQIWTFRNMDTVQRTIEIDLHCSYISSGTYAIKLEKDVAFPLLNLPPSVTILVGECNHNQATLSLKNSGSSDLMLTSMQWQRLSQNSQHLTFGPQSANLSFPLVVEPDQILPIAIIYDDQTHHPFNGPPSSKPDAQLFIKSDAIHHPERAVEIQIKYCEPWKRPRLCEIDWQCYPGKCVFCPLLSMSLDPMCKKYESYCKMN